MVSLLITIVLSGPCQIIERDKLEKTNWENSKVASCILNRSFNMPSSHNDITSQACALTEKCIE